MQKLQELISLCKASISIDINNHKSSYETIEQYVSDDAAEIDSEVLAEMIKRDIVFRLQVYPNTPIGFFVIYHYDIDLAIIEAIEIIKQN